MPGSIGERIHVEPVKDLAEHVLTDTCWCRPTVRPEGAGFVVIHNSLDGREKAEGAAGRPDS